MKILAAIDGSSYSQTALDALSSIHWPVDTEIKLLTVTKPGSNSANAANKNSDEGKSSAKSIDKIITDLQQAMPVCKISSETVQGDAKTKILEYSRKWAANLVIMGTRGSKGFDLMLQGSVSQGVLTQAPCPVVIVKSDPDEPPRHEKFMKVLVATDNSPYGEAALNWLNSLDWQADTHFRLVTVISALTDLLGEVATPDMAERVATEHTQMKKAATTELQNLEKKLASKVGTQRVSSEIGEGDPKGLIVQMATDWNADLIVMGSHGRTGLKKLFLGSVSQSVAINAGCSVAIVRGIVPQGRYDNKETGKFQMPKFSADAKEKAKAELSD